MGLCPSGFQFLQRRWLCVLSPVAQWAQGWPPMAFCEDSMDLPQPHSPLTVSPRMVHNWGTRSRGAWGTVQSPALDVFPPLPPPCESTGSLAGSPHLLTGHP